MEEVANPIAKASFDRVEPVVEKMYRRLGFGLRQARRRAIARHGVISAGVPTPESLVGPSWRLRRLQFPTTPATAPGLFCLALGHTPPVGCSWTHAHRTCHAGAGGGCGRSSAMSRRISWNICRGMATSAIWKANRAGEP